MQVRTSTMPGSNKSEEKAERKKAKESRRLQKEARKESKTKAKARKAEKKRKSIGEATKATNPVQHGPKKRRGGISGGKSPH
jgi:hypothetical protein